MPDEAVLGTYPTGSFIGTFSFRVQVQDINDPFDGFTKISEIKREIETMEWKEGLGKGVRKALGRMKCGDVTLERAYQGMDDFYAWFETCTRETDKRTVTIDFLRPNGDTVRRYVLLGAFPKDWTLPAMDATSSTIGIEKITLAVENMYQE
jgi:phage tail-like protein